LASALIPKVSIILEIEPMKLHKLRVFAGYSGREGIYKPFRNGAS
jgi:hypothetical protein